MKIHNVRSIFLFRHTLMLINGKRPEKMDQENSNLMPFLLSLTKLVRNINEKIRSTAFQYQKKRKLVV